jgi:hypothetical protein
MMLRRNYDVLRSGRFRDVYKMVWAKLLGTKAIFVLLVFHARNAAAHLLLLVPLAN